MIPPGLPQLATILCFPESTNPPHQLTMADRIEALHWQATKAIKVGARLAFHRWSSLNAHEGGDYISIYRGDDRWAAWGATRRGHCVSVWRCATGADLGQFSTMREALAALRSTPLSS